MINQIDEDFESGVRVGIRELGFGVGGSCVCASPGAKAGFELIKLMELKKRLDWGSRID